MMEGKIVEICTNLSLKLQNTLAVEMIMFVHEHILELSILPDISEDMIQKCFVSWYISEQRKKFCPSSVVLTKKDLGGSTFLTSNDRRVPLLLSLTGLKSVEKAAAQVGLFSKEALCRLQEGINRLRQRIEMDLWDWNQIRGDGGGCCCGADDQKIFNIFLMSISVALDDRTNAIFRLAPDGTVFFLCAMRVSSTVVRVMVLTSKVCGLCLKTVDAISTKTCPRCSCQTYCSEGCRVRDEDHKQWCKAAVLAPRKGFDFAGKTLSAHAVHDYHQPSENDYIEIDDTTVVEIATSKVSRMSRVNTTTTLQHNGYLDGSTGTIVPKNPMKPLSRQEQYKLKCKIRAEKAAIQEEEKKSSSKITEAADPEERWRNSIVEREKLEEEDRERKAAILMEERIKKENADRSALRKQARRGVVATMGIVRVFPAEAVAPIVATCHVEKDEQQQSRNERRKANKAKNKLEKQVHKKKLEEVAATKSLLRVDVATSDNTKEDDKEDIIDDIIIVPKNRRHRRLKKQNDVFLCSTAPTQAEAAAMDLQRTLWQGVLRKKSAEKQRC